MNNIKEILKEVLELKKIEDIFNLFFENMDTLFDYSIKNNDKKLMNIIDDVTDYESIYFDYGDDENLNKSLEIKTKIKEYIEILGGSE